MDDYDEFGNYIGALSDSEDEQSQDEQEQHQQQQQQQQPIQSDPLPDLEEPEPLEGYSEDVEMSESGPSHSLIRVDETSSNAIVLHEDKKYYQTAAEVYGEDVETLVQEEDLQPISQPIIEPVKIKKFTLEKSDEELPKTRFDKNFMLDMMNFPNDVRNLAVVGHLHHGKTSLLDMLVEETHQIEIDVDTKLRYTDSHLLARKRGISIKSGPISLVLQNTKGKSYLCNLIDTPGHTNFHDEVAASMRLSDGVLLVVDVVEGIMSGNERIIKHALREGLPIVLCLNKMDRLILELRLPPAEAYFKIKHCIEEINNLIASIDPNPSLRLGPELGNVCFASTQTGWCFTLRSFSQMYNDTYGSINVEEFSKRLWGNIYYNEESRNFTRKPADPDSKRSFVHFILEPIYKLYTQVLSSDTESLKKTLKELGITLKDKVFKIDVRPLLKIILNQFFGSASGLIDIVVENVPSPKEGAKKKVDHIYTGPKEGEIYNSMIECNPEGPLMVHITKLYASSNAEEFRAFGRILSGTLRNHQEIKICGEGFDQDDDEDMIVNTVKGLFLNQTRYLIPTDGIPAGNLCLVSGVDENISKTSTITSTNIRNDEIYIFKPMNHFTESVLKISVEPLNPSELPKMLHGLRMVNKSYPLLKTKVEESGEHVIFGTGELYLDCVMHDLRKIFSEIEIKVSDPVVRFAETVVETSQVKCYGMTPNKKNKLTIIAEPLEKGLAEDIENGKLNIKMPPRELGKHLQEKYGWDLLASRSVWAFGPQDNGPNILVDDTLPSEVDKKTLYTIRESIKQGFQWGTREGPLCDEPIRGVKFRILDCSLAPEPINRGGGQIIPTSRRVCYAAFLLASPRLMEPIYYVEVQSPQDCVAAVYTVLARRRGHVVQDLPKAGTPLFTVKAYIPVIDSNGFETDLRVHTQGQAFCLQMFSHWEVVPGDPLDTSVKLRPLEPAPPLALARDFVLKTRRRKGLNDQIAVSSYLDQNMVVALAASGFEFQ